MTRLSMFVLLVASAAGAEPLRQVATPAPDKPETLFNGDVSHGGYGGPRVAYGRVASRDALFVGGEGGWIINHSFIVGGAGYGLVTQQPMPGDLGTTDDLTFGYGGFMLGYTLFPEKLVHGTLTVLVGAGGISSRSRLTSNQGNVQDAVFVVEPTATFELNMVQFMRSGVAVSYRWVSSVDTPGLSNSDFTGVLGSFVIKFGKF